MEKEYRRIGFAEPFVFRAENSVTGSRLRTTLGSKSGLTVSVDKGKYRKGQLLDTFENHLLKAGRVLLTVDGTLLLLNLTTASVIEQKAVSDWRFAGDLGVGALADELSSLTRLRAFMPVGKAAFRVDCGSLLDDEKKTLARLRMVRLRRGKRMLSFGVTVPLRGYGRGHRCLERILRDCKARKNNTTLDLYQTLGISRPQYTAKPKMTFAATTDARRAARSIIAAFIAVARENIPGITADIDSEFLHDYRVSLRKIRSLLSLFQGVFSPAETRELKALFSAMMAPTGTLRDLDVCLLGREEYLAMVPATSKEGVEQLFAFLERERARALKKVVRALNRSGADRELKALAKRFRSGKKLTAGPAATLPAQEYGSRLILKRYRRICTLAAAIDRTTADEKVHELRINCKKLRYLIEFFAPFYPQMDIGRLLKSLKRLQDNLGRFNDCSVQRQFLRTIVEEKMAAFAAHEVEVSEAIGALTAMLNRRQLKERRQVEKNFARFDSIEVRALFLKLFSTQKGEK